MNRVLGTITIVALLALPATAMATQTDDPKARAEAKKELDLAKKQMEQAQQQMREAERQMREAERQMRDAARQIASSELDRIREEGLEERLQEIMERNDEVRKRIVVVSGKPRLGLVLRTEAETASDAVGATIQALTPGGPAEEAGLKVGDVITQLDGASLVTGHVEVDDDESAPAARLVELASELKDGQKVVLDYRRGSTSGKVTVTARTMAGPAVRVLRTAGPGHHGYVFKGDDDGDFDFDFDLEGPDLAGRHLTDMDLTSLNPELGEYFGTDQGVLVVRTGKANELKLKPGDVILQIDGRHTASPSQTLRILRSYDGGDKVNIEVMRKREKTTLAVEIPRWAAVWRTHAAPAPPAPPASPAPPAPPARGPMADNV